MEHGAESYTQFSYFGNIPSLVTRSGRTNVLEIFGPENGVIVDIDCRALMLFHFGAEKRIVFVLRVIENNHKVTCTGVISILNQFSHDAVLRPHVNGFGDLSEFFNGRNIAFLVLNWIDCVGNDHVTARSDAQKFSRLIWNRRVNQLIVVRCFNGIVFDPCHVVINDF